MTDLAPTHVARREAARNRGKFGKQPASDPELTLDIHDTEIAEGATRVLPLTSDRHSWYDPEQLERASSIAAAHDVTAVATRVALPAGTPEPYARYTVVVTSARTAKGKMFVFETGDQAFERTSPTVAEVLAEAATFASEEKGAVTADGDITTLDRLIAVVGEADARDLLADAYLRDASH